MEPRILAEECSGVKKKRKDLCSVVLQTKIIFLKYSKWIRAMSVCMPIGDSVSLVMTVKRHILMKHVMTLYASAQPVLKDTQGFATLGLHLENVNSEKMRISQ